MAKSNEPIEAEARVIETDLTSLSQSEEWLAQINERAELLAEQYKPHDIADERDYKDSKRARADVNREITAINQERKNMTAAIKRAVRSFEEGTKRAIEPLTGIVELYDEKNHAYEDRWRANREAELALEYADTAPFLVPLVPLELILEKYGSQKGKGWLNRTTNIEAAKDMLSEAVAQIAQAEKTIDSMVEEAYREQAKARYFRTLDLQATLTEEAEAKAQRDRMARLEAERRERIAQDEARRRAEEEARRRAEEDAWLERAATEPVEPGHVRIVAPPSYATEATVLDNAGGDRPMVPEPARVAPAPTVTEAPVAPPDPEQFEPAPVTYEPPRVITPAEVPHPWVLTIPSASRAQVLALRDWLNANGLTGGKVYSGTIFDAYWKENGNGGQ